MRTVGPQPDRLGSRVQEKSQSCICKQTEWRSCRLETQEAWGREVGQADQTRTRCTASADGAAGCALHLDARAAARATVGAWRRNPVEPPHVLCPGSAPCPGGRLTGSCTDESRQGEPAPTAASAEQVPPREGRPGNGSNRRWRGISAETNAGRTPLPPCQSTEVALLPSDTWDPKAQEG